MRKKRDDFDAFLLGFLIGSLIGVVIALLNAPRSGKATMTKIKEQSGSWRTIGNDYWQNRQLHHETIDGSEETETTPTPSNRVVLSAGKNSQPPTKKDSPKAN